MTQKKKHTKANKEWHTVHIRVYNEAYEKLIDRALKEKRSCTRAAEVIVEQELLKTTKKP